MEEKRVSGFPLDKVRETIPAEEVISIGGLNLAPVKGGFLELNWGYFYSTVEEAIQAKEKERREGEKKARKEKRDWEHLKISKPQKTIQARIRVSTKGLSYQRMMDAIDMACSVAGRCSHRKGSIRVPLESKEAVLEALKSEGFQILKVDEVYGY